MAFYDRESWSDVLKSLNHIGIVTPEDDKALAIAEYLQTKGINIYSSQIRSAFETILGALYG